MADALDPKVAEMAAKMRRAAHGAAAQAIRDFHWDNYGYKEVACALAEDPDEEWVMELAVKVVTAITSPPKTP